MAEPSTDGARTRFRMLETLREYGEEKLSAEDRSALQRRHFDYFMAFTHSRVMAPETMPRPHDQIETEYDNMRAALNRCQQDDSRSAVGVRLAQDLWLFWNWRGSPSEGRQYLSHFLSSQSFQRTSLGSGGLRAAALLAWARSDYTAAGLLFEQALSIDQELGDRRAIAESLWGAAVTLLARGEYAKARPLNEKVLSIYREISFAEGVARVLVGLANVAREEGDAAAARAYCEESLAIHRTLGKSSNMAAALFVLGLSIAEEDLSRVRSLYEESLEIYREWHNKPDNAGVLHCLGDLARREGDIAAASALYDESLALSRDVGSRF
jgi:tetratricopeptide (TPR) repeat protein